MWKKHLEEYLIKCKTDHLPKMDPDSCIVLRSKVITELKYLVLILTVITIHIYFSLHRDTAKKKKDNIDINGEDVSIFK